MLPLLYRVWLPGQAPTSDDSTLLLYNETSIRFFVESVASGNSIFTGKPFAMVAYHVRNQLFERIVAEGTYVLEQPDAPHLQGGSPLQVLYESGMRSDSGGLGIISAAIIDAVAAIVKEREREQIL